MRTSLHAWGLAAGILLAGMSGALGAVGSPVRAKASDIEPKRGRKRIVLVAGRPSHGYGSHEHNAGSILLANHLNKAMGDKIQAIVHRSGWPKDAHYFDGADAIVMFCDGGGGHMVNRHLDQVDKLARKGVGIACLHYGVEVKKGASGEKFLEWIGGYFEAHWSVNPHWTAEFKTLPKHPITRGVEPFKINDEWYFHMRFRPGMKGVTPILSAMAPESTMRRGNGAHSGNPHVRAAVKRGDPQHVAWAAERPDGGRGFGMTGAHFHWNWAHDDFRKITLNALVWILKLEVPAGGVKSATPTLEDLKANQDGRQGRIPKNIPWKNPPKQSAAPNAPKGPAPKPVFASKQVNEQTPGHSVDIDVDITGAKELWLVVTEGGDGYAFDWVDWVEPRLVGPKGEKKLTDLKWISAQAGWGQVRVGKNAGGGEMKVAGKPVRYGLGTHSPSVIGFKLPAGYTRFKAKGALDNGGTDQNGSSTVAFQVYKARPTSIPGGGDVGAKKKRRGGGGGKPEDALAGLDVADGLQATLSAAEPFILNPSSIDIDYKGRVWMCEVVNYRRSRNKRPEGDRILVLEDTVGDGKMDKKTVFFQGRTVDSAHGVCVLGEKIIVSVGDKVLVFTDADGNLKADGDPVALFTGIGGTQHDHGIHAFLFGPDGKLYFNFGNAGRQIKDKNGRPIVDMAGNVVNNKRKPYQDGMVFRCNLDGSEFETLGWNFRNNWEVTVDSFGTIWQSDNDDDGNRGVRINYVMEFGNYGYKDEINGRGWRSKRPGMHTDKPRMHWHLRDPGVVPNLLQTYGGSPTGIIVYEGDLLPAVFRGQLIHCDAGPNVTRAYPVTNDGAGYKARIENVLHGARDRWFRPTDVSTAPDGSLFIADWYDPGVGGHNARSLDSGRLFRIAPPGTPYRIPTFDFRSTNGAIEALKSPTAAVRYLAWQSLHKKGAAAETALTKMFAHANPRYRARALWLLGKIRRRGPTWVNKAIGDRDADIRIVGIRLARQLKLDVIPLVRKLVRDPSAQVRRECAIALRHHKSPAAAALWAELAAQHDGKDRWYIEALGIAADKNWDRYFAAWQKKVGARWDSPGGRQVVWRARAKAALPLLAKLAKQPGEWQQRYLRAFDFHPDGPEKRKARESLLD